MSVIVQVTKNYAIKQMAPKTNKRYSRVRAIPLKTIRGCTIELISVKKRKPLKKKQPDSVIEVASGEIMKNMNAVTTQREMFVLPSQMNGAEYPGPNYIIKNVMNYTTDQTGGPRGQLACDLKVAQYICDSASNDHNDGINYVRKITGSTPTIRLQNGYLLESPTASTKDCHQFIAKSSEMEILLSRNIAVCGLMPTFPLSPQTARHTGPVTKSRRVDVVYASAAPYGSYGNSSSARWAKVCKTVLKQQYYLALAAATHCIKTHQHQNYKINFMPLGGGVFENPFSWIYQALREALEQAKSQFLTKDICCVLTLSILTWEGRPDEFLQFKKLSSRNRKASKSAS